MLYSSGGGTASSPSPSSLSSTSSRPIRKSRLRRQPKKPVPTHLLPFHENRLLLTMSIACCFLCFSIVPIWILESMKDPEHHPRAVHGVHQLMNIAQQIRSKVSSTTEEQAKNIIRHNVLPQDTGHHGVIDNSQRNQDVAQAQNEPVPDHDGASIPKAEESARDGEKRSSKKKKKKKEKPRGPPSLVEQQAKPQFQLSDLQGDENDDWIHKSVDRGVAGRPSAPAMEGAQRAHIANCEINVDSLAYWNDPVGTRDLHYQSPFTSKSEQEQFITFSPDSGGWNNVSRLHNKGGQNNKPCVSLVSRILLDLPFLLLILLLLLLLTNLIPTVGDAFLDSHVNGNSVCTGIRNWQNFGIATQGSDVFVE